MFIRKNGHLVKFKNTLYKEKIIMNVKVKNNIKKFSYVILIIIFSCIAIYSVYRIAMILSDKHSSTDTFEELVKIVSQDVEYNKKDAEKKEKEDEVLSDEEILAKNLLTEGKLTESERENRLSKYKIIKEKNSDVCGWISIPNTPVNYPVMQTIDSPNFYLKRNFAKEGSSYGVPYLDERSIFKSASNYIIYGHNMKDGSMFAAVTNYDSKKYYINHPIICFDTLESCDRYQVVAAFRIDVDNNKFKYSNYINMDEKSFNEYVKQCKRLAPYDTKVDVNYGDTLITLSTCEYSYKNGRFVVVAKKLPA